MSKREDSRQIVMDAKAIGFINHPEGPYLYWSTTKTETEPSRQYKLNLRVLQVALLSEETSRFSAEQIRDALAELHRSAP